MIFKLKNFVKFFFLLILISGASLVHASITDGTIDTTNKSALLCTNDICTTSTQINFKPTLGTAIHITDTALTGHAWSETFGWIKLNPTLGGVTNTTEGILGGYAWGENSGWINFKPTLGGVTINSQGQFAGFAWSENYGWIKFDCSVVNACVSTDWRPLSARPVTNTTGSSIVTSPVVPSAPVVPPTTTPPSTEPVTVPTTSDNEDEDTEPGEPTTPPIDTNEPPLPPQNNEIPTINNSDNNTDQNDQNNQNKGNASYWSEINKDLNLILSFFDKVIESANKENIDRIFDIARTPTGAIVSNTIMLAGAISTAPFAVATVLLANPLSFSELFLMLIRFWNLLLVAFGIKKKNVPWGTVYDSVTKQPLDPAYVVLQDLNGNEIATCITDLDGRYGFLAPEGMYRIIANKTNYEFPSKKLNGQSRDELYQELYFNDIINLKEGEVITKNIPMDPLKFDWNEFAKKDQKLMRFFSKRDVFIARISEILFTVGFLFTIMVVIMSPFFYNIAILAIYVVLFILKRTIFKPRAHGEIRNKETKNPLSFAILRVFFTENNNEVTHKVTSKTGKYYCLIPNGTYYAKIENKNPDESYTLVHTSGPIEVKKGYLNEKFEV